MGRERGNGGLTRAFSYGVEGLGVTVLSDGVRVEADAVVVATGFKSSWGKMFDRKFLLHALWIELT